LDHFHVTEIEVFEITNYRGAKKSWHSLVILVNFE
jgi:hypothetical protein